jgi:hypothetical protein
MASFGVPRHELNRLEEQSTACRNSLHKFCQSQKAAHHTSSFARWRLVVVA